MAVTFETLKRNAQIFAELSKNPDWWLKFKNTPSLYIDIRKDNHVNVYYEGGSIARIHYCSKHKKLQVFIHHKYLGVGAPSKSNVYIDVLDKYKIDKKSSEDIQSFIDRILDNVKSCYSRKNQSDTGVYTKEKWSETYIKGCLINKNMGIHLDSEFAYKDGESDTRIDLVRCDNGLVTFVELKRMDDGRMLHKDDKDPEIVSQMRKYASFIKEYKDLILLYYQDVYDIKKDLGLPVPGLRPVAVNPIPQLLIFDRWERNTAKREIHRKRVKECLDREKVEYCIESDL